MIVFDSLFICEEAVLYSIELAKRTNSSLSMLWLLPFQNNHKTTEKIEAADIERHLENDFGKQVETARNSDVPVEMIVSIGDPSSELLKFLAGSRSIRTIVWGGRSEPFQNKSKGKPHWLVLMKENLECPVVVPLKKRS
ncbi:MAG: hypothetical protein GY866_38110 [Proteobacteria bacterium]|nr:hypothetical protein [Pseudomonadota bacterium]